MQKNRTLEKIERANASSAPNRDVALLLAGGGLLALGAAGLMFLVGVFLILRSGSLVNRRANVPVPPGDTGSVKAVAQDGREAGDFTLVDITGESVRLSDLRGKRVLLNVWAAWCPPCRAEMPDLEALSQKYKDDLVIIAVNDGDDAATVKEFAANFNLSFPVLIDENHQVSRAYKVRGLPTSFFIDSQGIIRNTHIGQLDESLAELYLQNIE